MKKRESISSSSQNSASSAVVNTVVNSSAAAAAGHTIHSNDAAILPNDDSALYDLLPEGFSGLSYFSLGGNDGTTPTEEPPIIPPHLPSQQEPIGRPKRKRAKKNTNILSTSRTVD